MNHADVRELLELAAVESGGLDRIAAGDTREAAAVAGHLAGCPACLEELERLRRSSGVIREFVVEEAIADEPAVILPPELRERTLALIRQVGVARPVVERAAGVETTDAGSRFGGPIAVPDPDATGVVAAVTVAAGASRPRSIRPGRRTAWVASIAAAVVLSVVATSALTGARTPDRAGLADVVRWSSEMAAAPDARRIVLTAVRSRAISPSSPRPGLSSWSSRSFLRRRAVTNTGAGLRRRPGGRGSARWPSMRASAIGWGPFQASPRRQSVARSGSRSRTWPAPGSMGRWCSTAPSDPRLSRPDRS